MTSIPPTKLAIGWFSFTCCEDSTILFSELLNKKFDTWRNLVDFRHVHTLKSTNSMEGLDVAFIEGAISSESQAEKVKKIRENAKYIVAIGSCACTGSPSSSRNEFSTDQITERIEWYLSHFNYSDKVQKLDEVIKVDDLVPGCPMNVAIFEKTLTKYLELFKVIPPSASTEPTAPTTPAEPITNN